jgi:hypothetical protein
LAASVAALPEVVQLAMLEVVVGAVPPLWMHVGVCPVTGGPTVPWTMAWVPVSVPLVLPEDGICAKASLEQLTGMSWPRKKICGWAGSLLHCTMEAVAPGVKPVPATLTTSPPTNPVQTGAAGLESLHDAPAAVVVRVRVMPGLVMVVRAKAVPSRVPPTTRVTTPVTATILEDNRKLERFTFPPNPSSVALLRCPGRAP